MQISSTHHARSTLHQKDLAKKLGNALRYEHVLRKIAAVAVNKHRDNPVGN